MLLQDITTAIVRRWLTIKKGAVLQLEAGSSINAAGVTITAEELARSSDTDSSVVPLAAATATLGQKDYDRKTVVLNRAAGQALTLEAATGSGTRIKLVVLTTVTSNTTTIRVANSSDIMQGLALQAADAGSTANAWETGAADDTITLNGSTTGGIKGDEIELQDIAANTWQVRFIGSATGTEATPFSSTV